MNETNKGILTTIFSSEYDLKPSHARKLVEIVATNLDEVFEIEKEKNENNNRNEFSGSD